MAITKNRGPGHENIGPGSYGQWSGLGIDPAIHFQAAFRLSLPNQAVDPINLGQSGIEEMLVSETGVDRHDEHLVHIGQDLLKHD